MKIHVVSLGCPKNRVDTESMLAALPGPHQAVEDPETADLVLVNTCAFIQPAVEESVHEIVQLIEDLRDAPSRPLFVVAGCLVSRYGARDLAAELPEVDLFVSTRELNDWPDIIGRRLGLKTVTSPRVVERGQAQAYLKIAEGCERRCAFCAIPSIRGPLVSRPMDGLIVEARGLLESGARELTLVAQDLTIYGKDLGLRDGLRRLVESLLPLPGLEWLRLMYLYPTGLDEEFLRFMAQAGPPLLPYLDVPLQHANARVLESMGRPFARDPRRVVERAREHLPGASLRTTLIAGYPGETVEAFEELLDFVAWARFDHLGVFPWWAEEGTAAVNLPDWVEEEERARRRDEVMSLQAEISEEHLEKLLGEELDVLVEAPHEEWPGLHLGRVWFQAPEVDGTTWISGPGVRPGMMARARIEETKVYDLVALT